MVTLRVIVDDVLESVGTARAERVIDLVRMLAATAPAGCELELVVARRSPDELVTLRGILPDAARVTALPLSPRALAVAWASNRGGLAGIVHAPTPLAPVGQERFDGQIVVGLDDARHAAGSAVDRRLLRRALRFADAVVVATHAAADALALPDDRVRVIAPGPSERLVEAVGRAGARPAAIAAEAVGEEDEVAATERLAVPGDAATRPRPDFDALLAGEPDRTASALSSSGSSSSSASAASTAEIATAQRPGPAARATGSTAPGTASSTGSGDAVLIAAPDGDGHGLAVATAALASIPLADTQALFLLGSPGAASGVRRAAAAARLPEHRIRLVDGRDPDAAVAAYRQAGVVLHTDVDDPLGAGLLDAFLTGAPVVYAGSPALREIAAEAGRPVDPELLGRRADAARAFAETVAHVLRDRDEAARLRLLGEDRVGAFTWRDAAERIWQLHAEL